MQNDNSKPGAWQARIEKEYAGSGRAPPSARPKMASHVDRLIASSRKHVHRIVVLSKGEPTCHMVYIPPGRAHAWRTARRKVIDGELSLADYGVVIASNPGLRPARATLELLREKYGFDA